MKMIIDFPKEPNIIIAYNGERFALLHDYQWISLGIRSNRKYLDLDSAIRDIFDKGYSVYIGKFLLNDYELLTAISNNDLDKLNELGFKVFRPEEVKNEN